MPSRKIKTPRSLDIQVNQRDQGQQRAQQGVQKKLEGCVDFVRPAPDSDDQVHGDQGGLEEHIEQHAIERTKHPDHQARQNQKCRHVLLHFDRDRLPTGDHHHQVDESGQHHEPQRNAVHSEVVVDVEALNPRQVFDELHRRAGIVKLGVKGQGNQKAHQRADQRNPARDLRLIIPPEGQQDQPEGYRGPYGKAQKSHGQIP